VAGAASVNTAERRAHQLIEPRARSFIGCRATRCRASGNVHVDPQDIGVGELPRPPVAGQLAVGARGPAAASADCARSRHQHPSTHRSRSPDRSPQATGRRHV
jgi:hypothetical protein